VRALVTGGAGFIGSHLVGALQARGDEVVILDDLSTGSLANVVDALNLGATLIGDSVTNPAAVARALRPVPDVIFHLAAQIDVGRALHDPANDATINLLGTIALLEGMRATGAPRIVLASTGGAIYGDADTIPTPETAPERPLSPYAASKLAAERYCELYARTHGVGAFILRLANVYGPRQDARGEGGVIARFKSGAAAIVFGDGLQTRDFVYVADVAEAFLAAGDADADGLCNVATGTETTILGLTAALGLTPAFAPAREGEVRRSCLDATRAAALLGWRARTPLAEGLTSTVAATRRATPA
jgi:UDP-glucose 4-epimerase